MLEASEYCVEILELCSDSSDVDGSTSEGQLPGVALDARMNNDTEGIRPRTHDRNPRGRVLAPEAPRCLSYPSFPGTMACG